MSFSASGTYTLVNKAESELVGSWSIKCMSYFLTKKKNCIWVFDKLILDILIDY